ncbi:hypothetical protein LguiB_018210 [Lonicera macranthoides]
MALNNVVVRSCSSKLLSSSSSIQSFLPKSGHSRFSISRVSMFRFSNSRVSMFHGWYIYIYMDKHDLMMSFLLTGSGWLLLCFSGCLFQIQLFPRLIHCSKIGDL